MPARFREVVQALKLFGVEPTIRKGKGSHIILVNAWGNTYPVSLHNGEKTELSDVYLRGICKKFSLDYDDFRKKL